MFFLLCIISGLALFSILIYGLIFIFFPELINDYRIRIHHILDTSGNYVRTEYIVEFGVIGLTNKKMWMSDAIYNNMESASSAIKILKEKERRKNRKKDEYVYVD